jgi:hypothetical protein
MTIPEVVNEAPSVTEDGALVIGSRTTTVYLVDPQSGAVIRAFMDTGAGLAEKTDLVGKLLDALPWKALRQQATCLHSASRSPTVLLHELQQQLTLLARTLTGWATALGGCSCLSLGLCPGLASEEEVPRKPLILGRREYSVRSLDADSGDERWNVSYSRIRSISSPFAKAGFDAMGGMSADVLDEKASTCAGVLSFVLGFPIKMIRAVSGHQMGIPQIANIPVLPAR